MLTWRFGEVGAQRSLEVGPRALASRSFEHASNRIDDVLATCLAWGELLGPARSPNELASAVRAAMSQLGAARPAEGALIAADPRFAVGGKRLLAAFAYRSHLQRHGRADDIAINRAPLSGRRLVSSLREAEVVSRRATPERCPAARLHEKTFAR
jgi:hypothetical protein